ncbi:MAG: DUF503 domain-containing protein [Synergistales bacterium]|nr:DUF503 domain-containing protein [Synergistales bacterium]
MKRHPASNRPFFGYYIAEFTVPWAQTRKDRRQITRSLTDHLRRGWNVSVADLSPDESVTKGVLCIVSAGSAEVSLREKIAALDEYLGRREDQGDFEVYRREQGVFRYDEFQNETDQQSATEGNLRNPAEKDQEGAG